MKFVIDIDADKTTDGLLCLGCKLYKNKPQQIGDFTFIAECKLTGKGWAVKGDQEIASEEVIIESLLQDCPLVPQVDEVAE